MAMTVNYVGYALGLAAFAIVFSVLGPGTTDAGSMGPGEFMDGFHGCCWFSLLLSTVALAGSLAVSGRRKSQPS